MKVVTIWFRMLQRLLRYAEYRKERVIMKVLTKKESGQIAVTLLQMQDILDRHSIRPEIYASLTAGIRDIAKAAGRDTEFTYTRGITNRVYGK